MDKKPRTVEGDAQERLDRVQKQIDDVKKDLLKMNQKKEEPKAKSKKLSALDAQREEYLQKKKSAGKNREDETLGALESFINKMRNPGGAQPTPVAGTAGAPEGDTVCERHSLKNCQSCKDTFGEKQAATDEGWMHHELRFDKKPIDPFARRDNVDDYVIIDPRVSPFCLFLLPLFSWLKQNSHPSLIPFLSLARKEEGQGPGRQTGKEGR